tara:strand:- start:4466 stop:4660 length:195 start_codon:yes stop_codon:yes gene_type:complete
MLKATQQPPKKVRKKRGRLPHNQRTDLIKDIRALLRVKWDKNTSEEDIAADIIAFGKIKELLLA